MAYLEPSVVLLQFVTDEFSKAAFVRVSLNFDVSGGDRYK